MTPLIKTIFIIISATFFNEYLYGQANAQHPLSSLPVRHISGIVKDSTDTPLPGAVIKLESPRDTISISSNTDGIFIFKNVKSATFVLTVSSIGYHKLIKKFYNNDTVPWLTLDPLVLRTESQMLNTVTVNGSPSIRYKADTVEYRAKDYKVHPNATVDELLKKMEGFEIGFDGTATHHGQRLTKAKLNGKEYSGGDIAQAIRNLPADIVEKIQVVDDYGDQAARTGVKDGDPKKVLNITTRADRSVGNIARFNGEHGNNDRFNDQLFVQRIDANQQLGVIAQISNTVNGVSSSGLQGGAVNGGGDGVFSARNNGGSGSTKSGGPSLNYRDQWGSKIEVVASYVYKFSNNTAINDSYGQSNSTLGPNNFTNKNISKSNIQNHSFNAQIDYTIDSANFVQITPTLSYTKQKINTGTLVDNVNDYTTGLEHQVLKGAINNGIKTPNYNVNTLLLHLFKKSKRNISFQFNIAHSDNSQNGEKLNNYDYYADSTLNNLVNDSLSHLLVNRKSEKTTYLAVLTYREPVSKRSSIEFTGQMARNVYNNIASSDTVLENGQIQRLARLDNIYNYSFSESRFSLNYRYNDTRFTVSLGGRVVPYLLKGNQVNNSNDGGNISTSNSYVRLIPLINFGYQWSYTRRITLRYSGTSQEPAFYQIQPFVDRTDPNNIIIGNPNLKPSFTNALDLVYNHYLPNSMLNISFNLNGSSTQDAIISNIVQQTQVVSNSNGEATTKTINQTTYLNIDGSHAIVGRYSLSKQLADRRYNLSLNGNITYAYGKGYSNDEAYHATNWRFDERLGPRINPNDNIEINPYIGYDISRNFITLINSTPTTVQQVSLAIDGWLYMFKTYRINYSATKSYVSGFGNLSNPSPFVVNLKAEKDFFQRRTMTITFSVYDLLHQNNFIQQTLTANGYMNTESNTLSRYFLIGIRVNLQKWSGKPTRDGRPLQRRGDGSFIYH